MFFIKLVFKPFLKFFLKHPLIGGCVLLTIYLYIAYRCLLTAWDNGWRRTPSNSEVAERWQQRMLSETAKRR